MAESTHWRTIPASHPSLPGHFPGQPVIPGVVILSEVWEVLTSCVDHPVQCTSWPSVKFLAPLQPDEPFTVEVEFTTPGTARFTCRNASSTLASGTVRFTDKVSTN